MAKFLDLAGLVALWAKIKALIGNGALKVSSNSGSATTATTTNEKTDKTLLIKGDGTWISGAVSGSDGAAVVTLSHGGPSTPSAISSIQSGSTSITSAGGTTNVITDVTVSADSKGHVTGVNVTRSSITSPNNANLNIKTIVNGEETTIESFSADAGSDDDFVIVLGSNIILTPDEEHNKVTISAVATAPNNGEFSINKKVGSTVTEISDFTADLNSADSFTLVQGDQITLTGNLGGKELTVAHETITNTNSSTLSLTAATATTYSANGNLLESLAFKHKNGHITEITPVYKKIGYATESSGGLMSSADKKALNQVNQTIANALTSAITPKGGVTPQELVDLVGALQTILSANHVGDLYQLVAEENTGSTSYGKPLAIGNTLSGDISLTYSYITEGSSITNMGTLRKEFAYGTYFMVVNEGTSSSPSYKLDVVSGLYDMSNYWSPSGENGSNTLKPIPVNTSDDDYEAGDQTIESICV